MAIVLSSFVLPQKFLCGCGEFTLVTFLLAFSLSMLVGFVHLEISIGDKCFVAWFVTIHQLSATEKKAKENIQFCDANLLRFATNLRCFDTKLLSTHTILLTGTSPLPNASLSNAASSSGQFQTHSLWGGRLGIFSTLDPAFQQG
jgi:hypothetical protein